MRRVFMLLVGATLLLSACTWRRAGGAPMRDRNVITFAEFESCDAANAFEIIERFRGEFLHGTRGKVTLYGTASAMPVVYVDHERYGPIELLRQIPASDVFEIRLLRSWEAVTRYGADKTAGVIEVTTRRE